MDAKGLGIVDFEVKSPDGEDSDPIGSFYAILSAPTKDRDGEVVDAQAFDPLPDHMTIDVDHGLSVATVVGSGTPQYEGDLLTVRGTYSSIPRAQEVRTLVREGHIRKMSVAFMNARREDDEEDGLPHVRKGELLNAAFVAVPSNREAEVLVGKSLAKGGARNSAKDSERLQSIHDLAVENGATCDGFTRSVNVTAHNGKATTSEVSGTTTETPPEGKAAAPAAAEPLAKGSVHASRLRAIAAEAELLLLD